MHVHVHASSPFVAFQTPIVVRFVAVDSLMSLCCVFPQVAAPLWTPLSAFVTVRLLVSPPVSVTCLVFLLDLVVRFRGATVIGLRVLVLLNLLCAGTLWIPCALEIPVAW